jgi:hypothetical protein
MYGTLVWLSIYDSWCIHSISGLPNYGCCLARFMGRCMHAKGILPEDTTDKTDGSEYFHAFLPGVVMMYNSTKVCVECGWVYVSCCCVLHCDLAIRNPTAPRDDFVFVCLLATPSQGIGSKPTQQVTRVRRGSRPCRSTPSGTQSLSVYTLFILQCNT